MLQSRAKKGLPTPAWDNRPLLDPSLILTYDIFFRLHSSRSWNSGGPQKIRLTEIEAVFNMVGLTAHTIRFEMYELICAVDNAYITWHYEKRSKESKPNG